MLSLGGWGGWGGRKEGVEGDGDGIFHEYFFFFFVMVVTFWDLIENFCII